ncbi:Retrovirus-related Pol polyprotein from transposon TNT 1-94 [Nymphaea thermarum]|nr:Retrovirus-related Pol polyprotein from transposon TNT 1-94 [Nymphaea thermarum]
MADSSSSSTVHTNVPDVGSTRTDNVPVQVTTIQLNKENYLRWSAAITMGIAGRGRIAYVNGRKVEPVEGSIAWDTWYLEDNQVKMWIINSVSSDIQPLILRKKTARDMWVILEHMYGHKKRKVRVYQLMRDVYSLRQGTRSVAEFYAALKSKWEDLDYHSDLTWKCPQDQMQYMTKEWENRVFLFLSGLNDDYENIRSQFLNSDESFSIEDVYARVEAEEQRKLVSSDRKGEEQSAFVSRASVGSSRSSRKCTHCKKLGHTIDFCWDLHPEKKNSKGRPSASKQRESSVTGPGDRKGSFSAEQLRELRAYLSQADGGQTEKSDDVKGNHALAVSGTEGTSYVGEWIVDSGATHHMTGNPKLFHDYKLSSGKERVSLVDGSFTSVAGKGSLSLLNNFLVHDALHVPHLPLNLLSVSKITKELKCELIFSEQRCVL